MTENESSLTVIECVTWDGKDGTRGIRGLGLRTYFECAAVSMYSLFKTNPSARLLLYTNAMIPAEVLKVLDSIGCEVKFQPFDSFVFGDETDWHDAYYKLCVLKHAVENEFSDYWLLLDTDTWVSGSLDGAIKDCPQDGVMLYDMHAPFNDGDRVVMHRELSALLGHDAPFATFCGGEFILGDTAGIKHLADGCEEVYRRMVDTKHYSKRGDEFLYYAADGMGLMPALRPANPYLSRCWTGRGYSVPDWTRSIVLHLPMAKTYGFPKSFGVLKKRGYIRPQYFYKVCGLRKQRRPFDLKWGTKRFLDKVFG